MKDITPILSSLGLLDSEIKTYMSALENGPGTVLDFAKLTKLSRQAVYVAIDSLTERGLMSYVMRGKKRYYAAENPAKLLDYAHRKDDEMRTNLEDLKRLLPELEMRVGGERPVVKLFEGKDGFRAVVSDIQEMHSKEIDEITDLDAMKAVLSAEDRAPMLSELKKTSTFVRGIYTGEPTGKVVEAERHFLPKDQAGFKSNITVYGDRVALVTFEGKMHSIIIESGALAKALRILFGLAHKGAKDLPKK